VLFLGRRIDLDHLDLVEQQFAALRIRAFRTTWRSSPLSSSRRSSNSG